MLIKPVSFQSLMRSLEAMVVERELLLRRIDKVASEVENAEQLTELVLWIDEAVSELYDAYEVARDGAPNFLHAGDFLDVCRERTKRLLDD